MGADFLGELLAKDKGGDLCQPQDGSSKLSHSYVVHKISELGTNLGSELRAYPCTCPDWGWKLFDVTVVPYPQLLQHLKRIISDLCKLYNLPQHPDVEMLDQPLPADQVRS